MPTVRFRFYAELNEHLPSDLRYVELAHDVVQGVTLGEAIESLGVPQREVELLVMGKESVDLAHVLQEGERVGVFPVFDSFDVGPITEIVDRPTRRMNFVLDVHLGKLAHLLRMLGFDALYRNDYTRPDLPRLARDDDRILLSRGKTIVEESGVNAAYQVKSDDPREQLVEILRRFDLVRFARPFRRCILCNSLLVSVQKEKIVDRLPAKVRILNSAFTMCPHCDRIYWKGSHVVRMAEFIDQVVVACRR
ncbi:MAG: Mut7-C RNAse domain-containing protein [Bacteroidota bacterium]